jgi:transcriptional regulator with XRE-family HTH domain
MPLHDPLLRSFGDNVRKLRERKGYTQERLGEAAALDPTYVSGIERGVRNPGIRNVARLAKALGVSTSKLVEGVSA